MNNYNVLIVEDDFRVADINKSIVERVDGFNVVGIAKTATEALSFIEKTLPDLLLVDIYLPDFNGMELIKKIRKTESPVDIILITAAIDSGTVENSMRYGVFDYIIKPFDISRFTESLNNYKKYRSSITNSTEYDQSKINDLISYKKNDSEIEKLPKGITAFTLEKVTSALDESFSTFTIDDIILKVGLSKITVRRYLEFLFETGKLKKSYEYKKIGRPTTIYSKKL